jgi:hypothetical protein
LLLVLYAKVRGKAYEGLINLREYSLVPRPKRRTVLAAYKRLFFRLAVELYGRRLWRAYEVRDARVSEAELPESAGE